jgi:hypothetical protein
MAPPKQQTIYKLDSEQPNSEAVVSESETIPSQSVNAPTAPSSVNAPQPPSVYASQFQLPSSLNSPLSRMQSTAHQPNSQVPSSTDGINLRATADPECKQTIGHTMGVFCQYCRAIPMPWGDDDLPVVTDDLGVVTEVGPAGSILEGVALQNPVAIAIVAAVAYLRSNGMRDTYILELPYIITRVPEARAAGERIGRLYHAVHHAAERGDEYPSYDQILYSVLADPEITEENYLQNTINTLSRNRGRSRANNNDREMGRPPVHASVHAPPPHAPLNTPLNAPLTASLTTSLAAAPLNAPVNAPVITPRHDAATLTPEHPTWHFGSLKQEPPTPVDDHRVENMTEEEWLMTERTNPTDQKKNRPPPPGDWEFVPGTDLSDPVLGQPDPSKFFLIRQMKSNPLKKDCRQLPDWAKFDWNDPDDIEHLKKHRSQIRNRTSGSIAQHRPPWTLAEKEVLTKLVEKQIKAGATKKTVNWEKIARGLTGYFKDRTQKKGSVLAQTSKLIDGKLVEKYKKPKVLNADRVGDAGRHAKSIQAQASKYGDIQGMLLETCPEGLDGKHRAPSSKRHQRIINTKDSDTSSSDTTTSSDDEPLAKRRPRKKQKLEEYESPRDDIPKGPKKPPGPPPPSSGAAGLAGPIGKASSLDIQRTPLPGAH